MTINQKSPAIWGIISIIFILIVIFLSLNPFVFIETGERGVLLTWSAWRGEILEPGLSFKMPLAQSVIPVNVRTQTLELKHSEAYSKDLQLVEINSMANYNILPDKVGEFYKEYGTNIDLILTARLEAAIKQVTAQYTAEELLQKRSEVQSKIQDLFAGAVPNVIMVSSYSLIDEAFSTEYEAAIERKQIAQQEAEKAENELKKTIIEAEQRVTQAKAEAEAIRVQSEAANNDKYISLKQLDVEMAAIEKWDGKLPTQMIPEASLPFLSVR